MRIVALVLKTVGWAGMAIVCLYYLAKALGA